MYRIRWILGAAILLGWIVCPAEGLVVSTFDAGPAGWLVVGFPGGYGLPVTGGVAPDWAGTAGNPGGAIRCGDWYAETFFSAPAAYLGDQSAAFDTALSFDIHITYTDGAAYPAVILVGASKALYYTVMSTPVGVWTTRNIPLRQGWKRNSWLGTDATDADMLEVLSDLRGLYINAEWKTGSDLTTLDNVVFQGSAGVCGDGNHPYPPGDLNRDCWVRLDDYALFAGQWALGPCGPANQHCQGADLDGDGELGLPDLAILVGAWLTCTHPDPPCSYY
ncbi:MAG: hypothetical protein JW810_05140 [Sedimentisphaerales bacterium]|nr:hypothetical protein [Sedimentisphaerales bacterium]